MTKSTTPASRGLRPTPPKTITYTTSTSSTTPSSTTTTVTTTPSTSITSTTSTSTGKGTGRTTTTNTTTTTSEYFYPTQVSSTKKSPNTTTAVSLNTSLPTDALSTTVTEPTNTSTEYAVVQRTTSTTTGGFGNSSSSSTTFRTQSNASSVSTTFTNSTSPGTTQTNTSTPTIETTSQSSVLKTSTYLIGNTSSITTTPSDPSQPSTTTTSTTLGSSSKQNSSTTFSFPSSTGASARMSVSTSSSGSDPIDTTLSKSVVMHTTSTTTSSQSLTTSPPSTTSIYADNGREYVLTTTSSTSSPTATSSTKSFTPTTTFTVGTTGSTTGSSSTTTTTTYFLNTAPITTTTSSNWRMTDATATFTSSPRSSSTPSIDLTLSRTDSATSSSTLTQSFSTSTLSGTLLDSTTNVASVLANVTNVPNFTNVTLDATNRRPGSSSIGFTSASSDSINEVTSAGISPTVIAAVSAGVAFTAAIGAFWYAVWNRAGAFQGILNSHLALANTGSMDEITIQILRAQGRTYMNRLAYSLINGRDAPSLRDRIEQIVNINSHPPINPVVEAVRAQTDSFRTLADSIDALIETTRSQMRDVRLDVSSSVVIPEEARLPAIRVGSTPTFSPTLRVDNPSDGGRRLTDLHLSTIITKDTRIVDLWSYLMKVEQLTYSNTEKFEALALAQAKVFQILNEGGIDQNDVTNLYDQLIPLLQREQNAINLIYANLDSNSKLAGTQNLQVTPITSSNYSWNINFMPSGAFKNDLELGKGRIFLMDPNRPVFDNSGSGTKNLNSILLDTENSQYIGSDANEFITIGGGSNTTYNIAAMGGDDVIVVDPQMMGSSVVNIFGGSGKNTYLINFKGSWDKLTSTVHIWDFDRTKDSIIFLSSDRLGGVTPYIKESKRTLFDSTVDNWSLYPNGEMRFVKSVNQTANSWLVDSLHDLYSNSYLAAEHEFTGEGLPLIIIDEKNYSASDPNSLFSNPNVFRSSQTVDIADNISGETAPLFVGSEPNTLFSQLDSNNDHDLFKVHLTAGKIYVFKMQHNPYAAGDAVLDTTLVLKDAQGNTLPNSNVLISNKLTGNSRIDYVSLQDGDYFLDASGSAPSMVADNGKYSISAVEIERTDCWPSDPRVNGFRGGDCVTSGSFKSTTNHVGFKISLLAGDYVDLSFAALGSPEISIVDSTGVSVNPWFNTSISQNNQTFLAQKTGDYFIDARIDRSSDTTPYELHTNLKDVEGDYSTKATLNINNVVSSSINLRGDHDYFKVFLDANQKYQFDMNRTSASNPLDSYLRLFDSNQKKVAYNDDVNESSPDSRMVYRPSVSGLYYLDAGAFGDGTIGDYSLSYKII
jgi:hypothetical protein